MMRTFRSFITAQFTAVCFFAAINVSAQEVQVATNTLPPVIEPSISSSKDDRSHKCFTGFIAAEALRRVGVQTADTVPLTLDEAIRRALMNNTNIEIARDDVRIQRPRSMLADFMTRLRFRQSSKKQYDRFLCHQ